MYRMIFSSSGRLKQLSRGDGIKIPHALNKQNYNAFQFLIFVFYLKIPVFFYKFFKLFFAIQFTDTWSQIHYKNILSLSPIQNSSRVERNGNNRFIRISMSKQWICWICYLLVWSVEAKYINNTIIAYF